jgi:hypothetical protein
MWAFLFGANLKEDHFHLSCRENNIYFTAKNSVLEQKLSLFHFSKFSSAGTSLNQNQIILNYLYLFNLNLINK